MFSIAFMYIKNDKTKFEIFSMILPLFLVQFIYYIGVFITCSTIRFLKKTYRFQIKKIVLDLEKILIFFFI